MGNRIKVVVAGLATAAASIGVFGDDVARAIQHAPHPPRPPRITAPHPPRVPDPVPPVKLPPVEVPPVEVPPVEVPPVEVPPVVRSWTGNLSREDAEQVSKAACDLKDLQEFVYAESDDERWRIAYEHLVEEDKPEVVVGLAVAMLNGEDIDVVDEYCDLFG